VSFYTSVNAYHELMEIRQIYSIYQSLVNVEYINIKSVHCYYLKRIVHPKIKILSSFTL